MAEETSNQQDETYQYTTIWNTTTSQQFCQALGQLCGLPSIHNIKVPSFDSYRNPYRFISDFEELTGAFTDEQRLILIRKAFSGGPFNSWMELTLLPLIQNKGSWVKVKIAIVERFADVKHDERHFITLRELEYNPDDNKSLLEFVEFMYFCFIKAFGSNQEIDAVRYIKAAIPKPVRFQMCNYKNVIDITSISELKMAARQYDVIRGTLI